MGTREVAFDGYRVAVDYQDTEVEELLDFLFLDLEEDASAINGNAFSVTRDTDDDEDKDKWKLEREGSSLFRGKNLASLGTILMGDVLFHLIKDNDSGLAIHAGLVSNDEHTILLPGTSGSGKSSVTTWLMANRGMRYHTDELVTIDLENFSVKAFTRPLNIKKAGVEAVGKLVDLDAIADEIMVSPGVTMIPHRLVNPDFRKSVDPITRVIFPKYIADSASEVIPLSKAEAGLELMRSNVIARNLPSHGFSQITRMVRDVPAYRLHYQHFDDLDGLISEII